MQTLLIFESDRKVTLQKKKKKLTGKRNGKTGASATRRAAQADRGKGRVRTWFVNGSVGMDLVLAFGLFLRWRKWRKSGASSCHEAGHAQHGLPIVFIEYK